MTARTEVVFISTLLLFFLIPFSSEAIGSDSDFCQDCEEVVNYAKILLGSPEAKEKIKELLHELCEKTGPAKTACDAMVDENLDAIVEKISHLDTKTVCVELRLCEGTTSKTKLGLASIRSAGCDVCSSFVFESLKKLRSPNWSSILPPRICDAIGRPDLSCHHDVLIFLSGVRVAGSESYFCSSFCDQVPRSSCFFVQANDEPLHKPTSSCGICTERIEGLRRDALAKIHCGMAWATSACNTVPFVVENCTKAAVKIFDSLANHLRYFRTKTLCAEIGKCTDRATQGKGTALCDFCEKSVNYAKIIIGFPDSEKKVEKVLLDVCHMLGIMEEECSRYVKNNIQSILDELKHVDTLAFCHKLGVCSNQTATTKKKKSQQIEIISRNQIKTISKYATSNGKIKLSSESSSARTPSLHRENKEDPRLLRVGKETDFLHLPRLTCFTCRFVMSEAKNMLAQDSTVDLLADLALDICDEFDEDLKAQCRDFLTLYAKTYIKLAIEQLDPEQICVLIKACNASATVSVPTFRQNSLVCFGCQRSLRRIVNFWRVDDGLRAKVLNILQSACLRLPEDALIQGCVNEVNVMFPDFSKLVKSMDEGRTCLRAGACASVKQIHLNGWT